MEDSLINDDALIAHLRKRLQKLDEQREATLGMLKALGVNGKVEVTIVNKPEKRHHKATSPHNAVIDAILELEKQMGRAIKVRDVLQYLDGSGIKFGGSTKPAVRVWGIILRELKAEKPRIEKAGNGTFKHAEQTA